MDLNDENSLAENLISDEQIYGFNVRVLAKELDKRGREVVSSEGQNELDVQAAYLKMINIPCMFDVGTEAANPSD